MFPIHRKNDLVVQEIGDETFAYDLITNRAICLNKMCSFIWKNCDGRNSQREIAELASREFDEEVSIGLVELALEQLSEERLIENQRSSGIFDGLSRREILRKVGLTTMAALPIVTAITAPSAVSAQSACVPVSNGCTCTMSGMMGQECVEAVPCANPICRCVWRNNGNADGDCVV
ncbi:MAG: PqqD family protein [Acidobacteriota bacterium]|nr:MAG: PqqD family protein [Acidobacteriota bacterium]